MKIMSPSEYVTMHATSALVLHHDKELPNAHRICSELRMLRDPLVASNLKHMLDSRGSALVLEFDFTNIWHPLRLDDIKVVPTPAQAAQAAQAIPPIPQSMDAIGRVFRQSIREAIFRLMSKYTHSDLPPFTKFGYLAVLREFLVSHS